jgi:hypothetical protein
MREETEGPLRKLDAPEVEEASFGTGLALLLP